MSLRVVSAILFFPRGGSAQVARALAAGLSDLGCVVTLVAGSRTDLGGHGDARAFYGEVQAVSFDAALATPDPLAYEGPPGTAPMHPSYEARPGAEDPVFAVLDDCALERQVRAWGRELQRAGAPYADVLHLHHLTPLNAAAFRVAPAIPVVGHLHGTELLMLEEIAAGPPAAWRHAERWAERLRSWAAACETVVVSPGGTVRAQGLLELAPERLVELPTGVDTELFYPRRTDRRVFWQRVLVENPQGWVPGHGAGSARYPAEQIAALADAPILLYVGRFTAVKRLDRLIEAFAAAAERTAAPASLVLVGGHPGEWEGEHPAQTAARLGLDNVFLAGWHPHDRLPEFFAAADAVVSAAQREQFGQLLTEGMACGLPAVALSAMGPAAIVDPGRTGWLADPDDPEALVSALAEVLTEPAERVRRGHAAQKSVAHRFSWKAAAEQLRDVLAAAATPPQTCRAPAGGTRRRQAAGAAPRARPG